MIVLSLIVAAAVVAAAYYYYSKQGGTPSQTIPIKGTYEDGKRAFDSKIVPQRSLNQKEGLTFSYTCWLKIDDFAYRYGQPKVIFTKGPPDLSQMCPALFVDANTNSLLVKIDTFGGTEVIPISNIPAKKWLHFGLAVDQDSVDIYINGTLYQHHTLAQLPKQNSGTVQTGVGGGFDGKVGSLIYYGYFLTPDGIKAAMGNPPQPDPSDVAAPTPPYFDISWWSGRK
jgi:hypothetical protein